MKKSISLAVAAVGFAAVLAAPTAAFAQEAATVEVSASEGITWVDATVTSGEGSKLSIKILNVTNRSGKVWQRCDFNSTGAGTYQCGLDSTDGSLAQRQDGRWVAKAFVDGQLVGKQGFSL